MSLPKEFLTDIAREYELSPEQEEVFVEVFSSKKSLSEIAQKFHISDSAFRTRMSNVYKKFSIGGKGPGKRTKLLNFLVDKYRSSNFSESNQVELSLENINDLVGKVRLNIREIILDNCGTMKVLDMTQSIGLNDIYTNVNVLEKITSRTRKDISQIHHEYNAENFERFEIGKVSQERIPGIEIVKRYSKLMVLGKPGAGKTTFLKYLAIQCIDGDLLTHLLPIFITLRQFAEAENQPDLLEYITQIFSDNTVSTLEIDSICKNGRALILLDGLDEVREADYNHVLKQIRDMSTRYSHNQFVISCRIAAREYNFEKFTDVEVADFDDEQINNFANNWFKSKNPEIGKKFISKLEENLPVKELATNPLLLTLLCLEFEDYLDFPTNRSELYERGVGVLLSKWDAKRGIERDQVYKRLSLRRKEDLLSQVAVKTFERGDYFFKQRELHENIALYIYNLPDAKTDPEALLIDSEAVLKSIEAQHGLFVERARGIYSFSHLTFHEYFTARGIYATSNGLKNWVNHISETRWREVFLLVAGMLQNADEFLLLMKEKIDNLLASDEILQKFLNWAHQKASSIKLPLKTAHIRTFYLELEEECALDDTDRAMIWLVSDVVSNFLELRGVDSYKLDSFRHSFSPDDYHTFKNSIMLDKKFQSLFTHAYYAHQDIINNFYFPQYYNTRYHDTVCEYIQDILLNFNLESNLEYSLQNLNNKLPSLETSKANIRGWWDLYGYDWIEELRGIMMESRDLGYKWQFTQEKMQFNEEQIELLQKYYDANGILIECLMSDCFVTREVRDKIEDELFLPIAEIEKRKELK
ncbi:NACHT domain-containing protein [Okeania sp. SIO3I5]|uniref:NACHT C-terminal helical domain 2-containing protein n=1 Tax=Okeania sp. SIO3I5 TaxID=2607805 RepID=UPI0025D6CB6B|nr:NACHT domain-containing protein [Okeania sp. SIO3I5]